MCKFGLLKAVMAFQAIVALGWAPAVGASDRFSTQAADVRVEKIAEGLDTPWAMAMLPDGQILVTLRDGAMVLLNPANNSRQPVSGLPPIRPIGQGGLLDVILDRDFEQNRTLYFTFADPGEDGDVGTALARAVLNDDDTPKLERVEILFSMAGKNGSAYHFGSRIVQDRQGNLFFTIGDRGTPDRAQDPFDAAGSVLRISKDGTIPAGNPFADGANGLPQIWSIGHRNPQGATLNDETGELWTQAHGAKGGDEINIPEAGKNYGWPVISYGRNYSGTKIGVGTEAPGYEQPIHYWDPSIAPSGMDFYNGDLIPEWKGDLFIGALKFRMLVRLETEGGEIVGEENLFKGEYGRIRDVRAFPDGALWFMTDDTNGAIYRITKAE